MTTKTTIRTAALLLSASAIALSALPAKANEVLFSNTGRNRVEPGERIATGGGVLQVRLDSGATVSFVEEADFRLNPDGTIELYAGSVTVAGAGSGTTVVRMPQGVEGRVTGAGNAAVFTADEEGESNGHVLTGQISLVRGTGPARVFEAGEMWASAGNGGLRQVAARNAQAAPPAENGEPQVLALREGGPLAAAQNGLPVSLGDALAAAGASSDIIGAARRVEAAAANPRLDTYPTGDLALLVARAGNLSGAYGGTPFPQAQADIIRAYLGWLAGGGSGQNFLSAYAGFLTQYLGLIRAGGVPGQFGAASQADINAFLAFQSRRGALGQLSAQDRTLADAYLAFIRGGGNANLFASTYTDLVEAYFAFVRGGGDPAAFAGASTQTIDAYVAFLAESGLVTQLSPQDQELLAAYRANGSFAFAATYAAALQSYFGYLAAGNLPSASTSLTPAQLRSYLELLSASGQLDRLLGDQADFYAAYLAYLRDGGAADGFALLNANVFAGYAGQLGTFYTYLQSGGLPSAYTGDTAALRAYLQALADAGALEAFLGANAGFFGEYLAFLQGGGAIDGFAGLNANIFAGYANALNAYYAYLAGGGLPSGYSALTQEQIAAYVAALRAQGATSAFLAGLADFYADYAAFLAGGGNPDLFTGLPTLNLPAFADALNAYAAYLAGGGLPGGYAALDQGVLAIYLDALERSGQLSALLGGNASLLSAYFAYLETGGAPDRFSGLPLYQTYVSALQAYFTFLDNGGLPGDYTALTAQQVRDYLAALSNAGGFTLQLGSLADFYTAYFAYLGTGGTPNGFSGLPVYADYVSALNAYYAFLAGGGLPQAYTALTAQQIQTYLAALNAAGGFAAYSGLNAFFGQYYAFLAGGGNPASYSGLPVYASYVAALNAYYAFLAGGGVPSAYTVLTQQQIADYLAALNAAGGFAAYTSLNAFFVNYYTYLAGGGVPDNYTSLPGMGGGTITPPVTLAYAGGFNPSVAKINFITTLSGNTPIPGSETGFETTAYTLNANGGLTSYTRNGNITRTPGTATVADVSGNADVMIGRWHSGTTTGGNPFTLSANQGFHYVLARPVASNFALPTQGQIDYDLLAATRPTMVDGSVAPGGITADMAIVLGAAPKVAFDATVTMPGAGGGANQVFRYATTGGVANANQSTTALTVTGNSNFSFRVDGVSGTNCTDVNTCYFQANGMFAGDNDTLGLTFRANNDQAAAKHVIGALIFGNGTLTGGVVTPPAPTQVTTGLFMSEARLNSSNDLGQHPFNLEALTAVTDGSLGYELNASGEIVGFFRTGGFGGSDRIGTASQADKGSITGGSLLWTRWTNGVVDATRNAGSSTDISLSANQGYHAIVGTPATNLPTTGRVDYDLVGGTRPTHEYGTAAPGTLVSGRAAVLFGATPKVGIELEVTYNSNTYTGKTTGGLTDLSASELTLANGSFNAIGAFGNVTGGSCGTSCRPIWTGFLSGDGGEDLALQYIFQLGNSNNELIGVAGFTKSAGGGTPTPTIITGAQTGQHSVTANYAQFQDIYSRATSYDASGIIESYTISNGSTWGRTAGMAPAAEAGSVGGAMGWARWTSGSTQNGNLSANQGTHIISGTPATNLPASGTVSYQMIGHTKPTDGEGVNAPGSFTGSMAVDFATRKVGLTFAVTLGQFAWNLSTNGGSAVPSSSALTLSVNNQIKDVVTIIGTTAASCLQACTASVDGFLFGPGASHFGVTYAITDRQSPSNLLWVSGAAAFAAGSGNEASAPATTLGLAATPEPAWDRWEAGTGGNTTPQVAQAPGLEQTGPMGVVYSPEQLAQLEAWVAAQRVN